MTSFTKLFSLSKDLYEHFEYRYFKIEDNFYCDIYNKGADTLHQISIIKKKILLNSKCNKTFLQIELENFIYGEEDYIQLSLFHDGAKELAKLFPIDSTLWKLETKGGVFILKLRGRSCRLYLEDKELGKFQSTHSEGQDGYFLISPDLKESQHILINTAYCLIRFCSRCFISILHPETKSAKDSPDLFRYGKVFSRAFGKEGYEAFCLGNFIQKGFGAEKNFMSLFGIMGQYDYL